MSKQSSRIDLPDEDILEQCCLLPDFTGATEKKEDMSEYERFVQVLEDHGYKPGYKHGYFANRFVFFKSDDSKYDIAEHCGNFFMVVDGKIKYEKKIKTEEQLIKYIHYTDQINTLSKKISEMEKEIYNIFK